MATPCRRTAALQSCSVALPLSSLCSIGASNTSTTPRSGERMGAPALSTMAGAQGRMLRRGQLDFSHNPVIAVLPGPLGTSDGGWASEFRGVGPLPPKHLDMQETVKPIEENGFLLMDFTPETVTLRYFKWNQKSQPVSDIDKLESFHTTELHRA